MMVRNSKEDFYEIYYVLQNAANLFLFFLFRFLADSRGILQPRCRPRKPLKTFTLGWPPGSLIRQLRSNCPKGTLLTAGSLTIKESEITKEINQSEPAVRKQLTRNAFFLLENMATQRTPSGRGLKRQDMSRAKKTRQSPNFISEKIKISAVTEEELKNFHNQNKMIGNAPLEQLRETI